MQHKFNCYDIVIRHHNTFSPPDFPQTLHWSHVESDILNKSSELHQRGTSDSTPFTQPSSVILHGFTAENTYEDDTY